MDRIRVVGPPGSGKTTTAKEIANRLQIPHLELDGVHWLPDWQEREPEDFRRLVLDFAVAPRWVIDGNYRGRLGDVLDEMVDTYVWLDPPRWRAVSAVILRTVRRSLTREELWAAGNRERLTALVRLRDADNLALWTWKRHRTYRSRYQERARQDPVRWVRLANRRDVARFLQALGDPPDYDGTA